MPPSTSRRARSIATSATRRVVLDRFVEGGGDDLAAHGAAHVRDFLRALADEQHHEVDLRVVDRDAMRDRLEQHRLARLRRRDDQARAARGPRARTDRRCAGSAHCCRSPASIMSSGKIGVSSSKVGAQPRDFRIDAVDGLDAKQAVVLLRVLRLAHLAGDVVAAAQPRSAGSGTARRRHRSVPAPAARRAGSRTRHRRWRARRPRRSSPGARPGCAGCGTAGPAW